MSTIKEVAALAGVSSATVSLYMNGKAAGRISLQKQQEIEQAIQQLSYQPNKVAQRLRSTNSARAAYTVAVYWAADFRSSLLGKVIVGLQDSILENQNDNIHIVICPYAVNELYKEKGFLQADLYDAAIIANTSPGDMQYLDSITPVIPVVLLNRYLEQYHTVKIHNHKMGANIADLIHDRGYKRVAIFRTLTPYFALADRVAGFLEACREHDIIIPNDAVFFSENSPAGGTQSASDFLKLVQKPDVIFCDSDAIALGALHAFHKAGIRIPEDFSLIAVGLHNSSATQWSIPTLTVSEVPLREMAQACMDHVIRILTQSDSEAKHLELETSIIFRESFV